MNSTAQKPRILEVYAMNIEREEERKAHEKQKLEDLVDTLKGHLEAGRTDWALHTTEQMVKVANEMVKLEAKAAAWYTARTLTIEYQKELGVR